MKKQFQKKLEKNAKLVPRHVWCNDCSPNTPVGEMVKCGFCTDLYEEFNGVNDEDQLVKDHFPNIKRMD